MYLTKQALISWQVKKGLVKKFMTQSLLLILQNPGGGSKHQLVGGTPENTGKCLKF